MNPESATKLHKKNALVRSECDRLLTRLSHDRSSAWEQQSRELGAIRQELADIKACQVMYRKNRLAEHERRHAHLKRTEQLAYETNLRSFVSRMHSRGGSGTSYSDSGSSDGVVAPVRGSPCNEDDPFHLRAIVDVDCGLDPEPRHGLAAGFAPPPSEQHQTPTSARQAERLLRGSALYKHILAQIGQQRTSWILPGHCSSVHSLKEYYEQEKTAIARQWQPSERRRALAQRMLARDPQPFLVDRAKTLPEIYSDFAQHRQRPAISECSGSSTSVAEPRGRRSVTSSTS